MFFIILASFQDFEFFGLAFFFTVVMFIIGMIINGSRSIKNGENTKSKKVIYANFTDLWIRKVIRNGICYKGKVIDYILTKGENYFYITFICEYTDSDGNICLASSQLVQAPGDIVKGSIVDVYVYKGREVIDLGGDTYV